MRGRVVVGVGDWMEMMMDVDLRHGDCLQLMRELPDASVDMVLCDLPYGTTACKWDSVLPFEKLWVEYLRITNSNAAIVLTASQPFTSALVMSQAKRFKHEWIWRKNAGSNFATTKWQPMKEHESVLVFSDGTPTYNPIKQPRAESGKSMIRSGVRSKASLGGDVYGGVNKGYDNSAQDREMRVPSSVQNFNRERGLHPTQKPVALMEYLIRTYTNLGDVVLDNCMGSGTTGVACVNTGRRFIGMEMDAGYFEVARDRIEAARMPPAHIEAFAIP
jgi:site-specific DNA-methyltransferase (adenine-specific)